MGKPTTKLEGKAQITAGKSKKTVAFSIQPQMPVNISECLMVNFQDLDLSEKEKRHLTRFHRQELSLYRQITCEEIQERVEKLLREINRSKNSTLYIKGHDLGTFVCLAAIYSGKLPQDKTFYFKLGLAPLKMFPVSLIKNKEIPNSKIHFQDDDHSWLKEFQSLIWHRELPEHSTSFEQSIQNLVFPDAA